MLDFNHGSDSGGKTTCDGGDAAVIDNKCLVKMFKTQLYKKLKF